MKRGRNMCDVRRRENAAGVLLENEMESFPFQILQLLSPAAPSHVVIPSDTGRRRGCGRPKKCKRDSGGGHQTCHPVVGTGISGGGGEYYKRYFRGSGEVLQKFGGDFISGKLTVFL